MHTGEETKLDNIFSKDIITKLSLLNHIYSSPTEVDIYSLVQGMSLERRTIYTSINAINHLSEKNFKKKAIIFKNNKYFFNGNKLDMYNLKNSIANLSPITKLIYLLLIKPHVNLTNFCLEHFLIESTLKKRIKNMNQFLEPFHIKLVTRKNEITIVGNEIKIRYYFASFFWKISRGTIWPFHTISEKKLEHTLFPNSYPPLSSSKKKHLLYIIAINILRSKAKHNILSDALPSYYKRLITNSRLSQTIYHQISAVYPIPTSETEYILVLLHTFPEYLALISNTERQNIFEMFSPDMINTINHFLLFIENKHPMWRKNDNTDVFFSVIFSASISIDLFQEIHFNISSLNLLSYLNKNFPNLIPCVKNNVIQSNQNYSKEIQNALGLRFVQAYLTLFPPQDFEPEILIYLDTDLPVYVEKMIYNQIELLLNSKFKFYLTTEATLTLPDIILSTAVSNNAYPLSKTIYIEDEISFRDQKKIIELCQKLSNEKNRVKHH